MNADCEIGPIIIINNRIKKENKIEICNKQFNINCNDDVECCELDISLIEEFIESKELSELSIIYFIKKIINVNNMGLIDLHMISTIITSVGMIMLFLGIFFFGYATSIEEEIVKINTDIVTTDLLNVIEPLLDNSAKANIVVDLEYPDMSKEDEKVATINKDLVMTASTYLVIIFIASIIIGFILAYISGNNIWKILGMNIIILICVALTELTFLHLIPKKYISADTNFIRYTILMKIKEKFSLT